ncbi:MAG: thrombospondin type 3 repeat-containing protein [Chromatiales bacterium]|nr:thrombospondin type 3 repeat-containing protein [Chromatiales bacterium]
MRRLAASVAVIGLGLGSSHALAYNTVATIQLHWATDGLVRGWTSSASNTLAAISNDTYFSDLAGSNSTTYYNPDFAKAGDATGWCGPGTEAFQAQYACKISTNTPIADVGPGARAVGQVTISETTMTGTLTVINTNDEGAGPQPGTTIATGYNVRSADGSPFKNVWYGVSNQTTLTVNLTGTFNATSWEITGGTVSFFDPAFQCGVADFSGVLCNPSTVGGGFQANGQMLSWGMSQGTGAGTGVSDIKVFDATGANQIATLSGVRALVVIDGNGKITTVKGETRTGAGSGGGGCPTSLRYDGTGISCGTLAIGRLEFVSTLMPDPDDAVPDPFAFVPLTGVSLGAQVTSNAVTITGINVPVPVSVSSGEYSVNGGAYTAALGTVASGDTITVRQVSAATPATTTTAELTVGGTTAGFAVTTTAGPLIVGDDSAVAQVGTPLDIDVLANDTVASPATAIIDIVTAPLNGTVSIVGTGASRVARYVPAAGFQGPDTFQYAVQEGDQIGLGTVTVQVLDDADGDGITAILDNCTMVANANQRDTDGDGYGNACDGDLNNDGQVNFADLAVFRTLFMTSNPDADFNGDGIVNFADLARFRQLFGAPPGPSGLVP